MIEFTPKTEQFEHQKSVLEQTWDRPGYALWWEQGTGKSKGLIDNGAVLYQQRMIGGMLCLAPNGLHRNFITRELVKHLPDDIAEKTKALYWHQDRAKTKTWHNEARAWMAHDGFKVLGMSYDGICTTQGKALTKEFLTSTRCLYGADESGRIKNPEAWRTQVVLASAPFAPYRRILTGTPITNAPWDAFAQIKFLDDTFWVTHGLNSIESMKATFGEWEKTVKRVDLSMLGRGKSLQSFYNKNNVPECLRTEFVNANGVGLQKIPSLVRDAEGRPLYKNLEQLRDILKPIRSRVLKKDVFDLPPKLYSRLDFELTPAQRRCYNQMRDLGHTMIDEESCSANMQLTVLLRLQQIACGYLMTDPRPGREDPDILPIMPNPRLDLLEEVVQGLSHPFIVWARFTPDIDSIMMLLNKMGISAVRYDGKVDNDERAMNEDLFHQGKAQGFISNQAVGGEGLTLTEAKTEIYYSNSFNLLHRLQSEDRPHRWGQDHPVSVVDLLARGTMEEQLINRLIGKFDVASIVTGDGLRQWLTPIDRLF